MFPVFIFLTQLIGCYHFHLVVMHFFPVVVSGRYRFLSDMFVEIGINIFVYQCASFWFLLWVGDGLGMCRGDMRMLQ